MGNSESSEDPDPVVMGEAADTFSATANVRRNFSTRHLKAADHFAEELRRHETRHAGAGWGSPHFDFCTWYASAAIILGFSAIEAAIDEAKDDLALPPDASERAPTLHRAQTLLAHRGSVIFDKEAEPFQSTDLLRILRNGLVHPKAEWDNARDRNKHLSRKILDAHLPLSPFLSDPDLAFPYGCMSAGVATWAASSAREFVRELRSRLGLAPTA